MRMQGESKIFLYIVGIKNEVRQRSKKNMNLNKEEQKWVADTWTKLDEKLSRVSISAYDKIPYTTMGSGVYDDCSGEYIMKWTNGFWPGLMWLMYVGTGKEQYRKTAEHAEEMLDAVLYGMPWHLSHDVGFMWHISSGVNYRLFGGDASKARTLRAAEHLFSRFHIKGNYIRAWNSADKAGQSIIDCMMNLPLLYWAADAVKDKRFYDVAVAHADHTLVANIRPDGSVKHIITHDLENGEVTGCKGGQGYDEKSSWSRGQAWAIYGFTLSYLHTGKPEYLDVAKKVAHYFIANVAVDEWLPQVDFRAPGKEHDTTAGAIAACGLIELAKCVGALEQDMYMQAALKMLHALDDTYCDWSEADEAILQHGVEKYWPDACREGKTIIYGDYYFTEAIYKLRGENMLFW